MTSPGRKYLPHEAPANLCGDSFGEVYFITICCVPRYENQLARPEVWDCLTETIDHRESQGDLAVRLLLAMPDHLHGLISFDGAKPMKKVIRDLKSWMAKQQGIQWQRDFFDHRLRSWESAEEKGAYIRANPLRAGLIREGEVWPFCLDRRAR
jgi:putative transposase